MRLKTVYLFHVRLFFNRYGTLNFDLLHRSHGCRGKGISNPIPTGFLWGSLWGSIWGMGIHMEIYMGIPTGGNPVVLRCGSAAPILFVWKGYIIGLEFWDPDPQSRILNLGSIVFRLIQYVARGFGLIPSRAGRL